MPGNGASIRYVQLILTENGCLVKRAKRRLYTHADTEANASLASEYCQMIQTEVENDIGAIDNSHSLEEATVNLSACWSATYQVPVLYIQAFKTSGAPLSLQDMLYRSDIVKVSPDAASYPFSTLARHDERMPFLSQGDHPVTGEPAWFLHPCETRAIIKDVCDSQTFPEDGAHDVPTHLARLLDIWFMIVDSIVRLD
ncbi:hypothetical protein OIV83_004829 [Microbotryomycetes sp. JL201]|nr:hypothetical protein OIV83_004829 [Microbotryomycetes sp. JL201]